ncbi:hypothetical protein EJ07DRAFT_179474 [Lizonia empirigonia]|nr:hypothetical protein EJ07DRAFT_179474 [Lizonia empirigonia]
MSATAVPRVVPARLSFLAIYNPALGDSDETFHRQVVFYYARATAGRARVAPDDVDAQRREDENEKLRQVGLAQGMVGFATAFSRGEPVDAIETDRSRIVLHQLERGWWILASIDLTQLPAASPTASPAKHVASTAPAVEYSAREVSPPALLAQQLVRAHCVFTLHHGWPLDQLFKKHGRDRFCSILATYWTRFATHWDVLLHASPAVDMFHGLKLAAGGELGVGVGEEDWGSSERDVLEDFARRTEGLVDVLVSRFGEAPAPTTSDDTTSDTPAEPWLGSAGTIAATDGVVFSGVGGLTRSSLRDIAHWTEDIYHYGDDAYGVRDNPTSDRRRRRRRNPPATDAPRTPPPKGQPSNTAQAQPSNTPTDAPRIPPPIVRAVETSLDKASQAVDDTDGRPKQTPHMLASLADTDAWVKYMTLGYGTAWGGKKLDAEPTQPPLQASTPRHHSPMRYVEPTPDVDAVEEKRKTQVRLENDGYFLVGLKGDMAQADMDDNNDDGNWNGRIPLRTVYVERVNKGSSLSGDDSSKEPSFNTATKLETSRLRPVVYVHRPFIYTFLFAHRTSALSIASFYRDLHTFFAPLHRSLDLNTQPWRVAQRLAAAQTHQTTTASSAGPNTSPIYDIVWDPRTLTIHSSLPNIPDPAAPLAHDATWSRVDALNVHTQLLATLIATRRACTDIERTCKTARGWWLVWLRLPPSHVARPDALDPDDSRAFNTDELREAFLVRRARDAEPRPAKSAGSRIASGMWSGMGLGAQSQRMGGAAAGWGPKGLAEGIGIDARRYVDELLSLNR